MSITFGGFIYPTLTPAADHSVPPSMEGDGKVMEVGCYMPSKDHPQQMRHIIGSFGFSYIQHSGFAENGDFK